LPNELLCQIFMLNASDINQEEYKVTRRLAITQISSQVCREWRQIILSSPIMWGRLVLFDGTQRKEWIEEVLRRSGNTPLWIYCSLGPERTRNALSRTVASSFFFETLANNWERVEVVSYESNYYSVTDPEETARDWAFLHRPAPLLRVFSAWVYHIPYQLICCPNLPRHVPVKKSLFSAASPQLHTFDSNFDLIDHHRHNFKHLRSLHIYHHSNLGQLLHSLKMMPSLESLDLEVSEDYTVGNIQDLRSPIALPILSELIMTVPIPAFLAILDWIPTAPGCSIYSTIQHFNRPVISDSILEQTLTQICKVLAHFTEHAEGNSLFLYVIDDSYVRLSSGNRGPLCPAFSLSFSWPLSTQQYERILPRLLNSFHFANNVSDLHLDIIVSKPIPVQIQLALETWLLSLVSVTRLHYHRVSPLLNDMQSNLFPHLHTLYIDFNDLHSTSPLHENPKLHDLLHFLQSRINIGRPITTLWVSSKIMLDYRIFTEGLCYFFNGLDGLKVVCEEIVTGKKIEYLCPGSVSV